MTCNSRQVRPRDVTGRSLKARVSVAPLGLATESQRSAHGESAAASLPPKPRGS